jgi:hypothetical protein
MGLFASMYASNELELVASHRYSIRSDLFMQPRFHIYTFTINVRQEMLVFTIYIQNRIPIHNESKWEDIPPRKKGSTEKERDDAEELMLERMESNQCAKPMQNVCANMRSSRKEMELGYLAGERRS